MKQMEVDSDYLWALEVLACNCLGDRDDPPGDDVGKARRLVDRALLKQPMERL